MTQEAKMPAHEGESGRLEGVGDGGSRKVSWTRQIRGLRRDGDDVGMEE